MTAILIIEENKLDEAVKVSPNATEVEGVRIWLFAGEEILLRDLLKGLLIPSGNDAAYALAEHNAGNIADFVDKMNNKANLLGLKDTHFTNPAGFDSSNNYSTAHDLAILSLYFLKYPYLREIVSQQKTEIKSTNGKTKHELETTNKLLGSELPIIGLKTGSTPEAGSCLIALAKNNQEQEIITIVLNSPARFTESKLLLEWVLKEYKKSEPLPNPQLPTTNY